MPFQKNSPSAGGFGDKAGDPITPPIHTIVTPDGNAQKRTGGDYRPTNFKNAGPTGKRSRLRR